MNIYRELIKKAVGCNDKDAADIEEIMRDTIFHSTLDWQTKAQLTRAARLGAEVLKELRKEGLYVS